MKHLRTFTWIVIMSIAAAANYGCDKNKTADTMGRTDQTPSAAPTTGDTTGTAGTSTATGATGSAGTAASTATGTNAGTTTTGTTSGDATATSGAASPTGSTMGTTDQGGAKGGSAVSDAAITAKVKTAIIAEPGLKSMQINVKTADGVVTLSGAIDSQQSIDRAKQVAQSVSGVKSVDNQLTVKSSG
ncbi:BON domain-containing protein [Undibacterium arcticum]|uniref:BON domain-containing protein n=1 Tax=Undibacterium arcticum TaxID=1762892 RepID=A0ABV7F7M7_9BURK